MKLFSSGLAFVFVTIGAALILGFAGSGLSAPVGWTALTIGVLGALAAWHFTEEITVPPMGTWDFIVLAIFLLASLRAFLWLIYARGDEICVLSPNNLGDMSLHLNFIRYLASGVPFWPESPILSGGPLTYPLGADLFNSVIQVCGGDTARTLIWTGLGGAALTGYALWRWGGAFGVAAFLFNGGLAGFALLRTFHLEDFQSDLIWKNIFLSMFVTQRGLLIALPAGLLLLHVWREAFFRSGKRILPLWLQCLFYAGMPLFSVHSFLFISLILAVLFAARKTARRPALTLVAAAFIPATISVLFVTGFFSAASSLHLEPGWITEGVGWTAWLRNFGLTLPLVFALGILLIKDKDSEARCFAWTSLVIFALCCVVIFTAWNWDNMKLMVWCWLVIAPFIWSKVIAPLPSLARAALCFVLFFSGAVSLTGGLDARHGYPIAHRSELDAWRHAIADIPPEARFACVPNYNHPLLLLGRKVACGYEGHLWSHGLDYQKKLALLRDALAGKTSWQIAAPALDVQWLALRQSDLSETRPPGPMPSSGFGALYDLKPLLTPDSAGPTPRQLPPQLVD